MCMKDKKILLNYSNCMDDIIGPRHGISRMKLQEFSHQYLDARMKIVSKRNSGKLGFMDLPFDDEMLKNIKRMAAQYKNKFQNLVVIGIGGSALGTIAVQTALQHPFWNQLSDIERKKFPKIYVTDNIDPERIQQLAGMLDMKKTLFNVISKSGSTAECIANYFVFKHQLIKRVGKKQYVKHIVITTDQKKGFLREHAQAEKIPTLPVPDNVGGRFSVLSPVGLFPCALTGIDVDSMVSGARAMHERCETNELQKNCAGVFGLINYLMYQAHKRICVFMPYSDQLKDMADWYRQLWAESLGKRTNNDNVPVYVGPTPVKALGVTDQHSQIQLYTEGPNDKIIVFVSVEKHTTTVPVHAPTGHYLKGKSMNTLFHAEELATRAALTKHERPNMSIIIPEITASTIGQLIYMLELATAYAGEFFCINAYDQPGVELGKQYTFALIGRKGYENQRKELEVFTKGEKKARGTKTCPFVA
ncbi:MAG: glucose-6-phosphate isomerase [Elusimicrobia bacterium]|nr:glucose-6-phosphate isomerase [Elusimicrobiota bacterium]MBD3412303.1 glucose-6-phosphate isomerase [Elusimicrobiota bacterium]